MLISAVTQSYTSAATRFEIAGDYIYVSGVNTLTALSVDTTGVGSVSTLKTVDTTYPELVVHEHYTNIEVLLSIGVSNDIVYAGSYIADRPLFSLMSAATFQFPLQPGERCTDFTQSWSQGFAYLCCTSDDMYVADYGTNTIKKITGAIKGGCHAMVVSGPSQSLYVSDGAKVLVFDISDVANPVETQSFGDPEVTFLIDFTPFRIPCMYGKGPMGNRFSTYSSSYGFSAESEVMGDQKFAFGTQKNAFAVEANSTHLLTNLYEWATGTAVLKVNGKHNGVWSVLPEFATIDVKATNDIFVAMSASVLKVYRYQDSTQAPPTPAPPTLPPSTLAPPTPAPLTVSPPTASPPTDPPATLLPETLSPPTPTPQTEETVAPETKVPSSPPTPSPTFPATVLPMRSVAPSAEPGLGAVLTLPPYEGMGKVVAQLDRVGSGAAVATSVSVVAAAAGVAITSPSALRLALVAQLCEYGQPLAERTYPRALNPTQWSVLGSQTIGMVLGNIAICVAVLLLVPIASAIAQRCVSTQDPLGLVRFPSTPFLLFQMLSHGVFLGGATLIAEGTLGGIILGIVSLIGCIAVALWLFQQVTRYVPELVYFMVDPAKCRVPYIVGQGEWVSRRAGLNVASRYMSVLLPYVERFAYFAVVELFASFCLAAVQAMQPDDMIGCGHRKLFEAAIFLAMFFAEFCCHLHARPSDRIFETLINATQCAAMLSLAFSYYSQSTEHWGFPLASGLLMASVALLLLKTIVSGVGELYVHYLKRRARLQQMAYEKNEKENMERLSVAFGSFCGGDNLKLMFSGSLLQGGSGSGGGSGGGGGGGGDVSSCAASLGSGEVDSGLSKLLLPASARMDDSFCDTADLEEGFITIRSRPLLSDVSPAPCLTPRVAPPRESLGRDITPQFRNTVTPSDLLALLRDAEEGDTSFTL